MSTKSTLMCLIFAFLALIDSVRCDSARLPTPEDVFRARPVKPPDANPLHETIEQLKSSISLLSSELNLIKEHQNCTGCIANEEEAAAPGGSKSWSRMAGQHTFARDNSQQLQPPLFDFATTDIERWPRPPHNNKYDQRQQRAEVSPRPPNNPTDSGPASGLNCACLDGQPGLDGAPGLDGVPGADGRNGRDGLDGKEGRDGKDGQQGERGPPGLPGSTGEPGRRGRPGAPGKVGPPGPAGICAYHAKFDCSSLSAIGPNSSSLGTEPTTQLLMAPTMVGGQHQQQQQHTDGTAAKSWGVFVEERQVSVNEGDNIQLSCEAFGLPRPIYVWRRSDKRAVILLDAQTDLRVTSYMGSQLPLARVDRRQAGSYECLASNGVPPSASKRISLDINYKPTIRLYPTESPQRPQLHETNINGRRSTNRLRVLIGSSVSIECLVEANPSALVYWMFENELIMSVTTGQSPRSTAATTTTGSQKPPAAAGDSNQSKEDRLKRYLITESAGQLIGGASYSILTLNITRMERADLGQYRCVGKNLIDQTVGTVELVSDSSLDDDDPPQVNSTKAAPPPGTASSGWFELEQLDPNAGWPNHLIERDGSVARYATYGNELKGKTTGATSFSPESMLSSFKRISMESSSDAINKQLTQNADAITKLMTDATLAAKTETTTTRVGDEQSLNELPLSPPVGEVNSSSSAGGEALPEEDNSEPLTDDELELCRVISAGSHSTPRSSSLLLDQIGKPVYVGNGAPGPVSWWSLDAVLKEREVAGDNQAVASKKDLFVTLASRPDLLLEYESLADFQRDLSSSSTAFKSLEIPSSSLMTRRIHKLVYPIHLPGAQLVHDNAFYYIAHVSHALAGDSGLVSAQSPFNQTVGTIDELVLVVFDLRQAKNSRLTRLDGARLIATRDETGVRQPLDLGSDYKLNRVELMADENGIWLLLPSVEFVPLQAAVELDHDGEKPSSKSSNQAELDIKTPRKLSQSKVAMTPPIKRRRRRLVRRIHVIQLKAQGPQARVARTNDGGALASFSLSESMSPTDWNTSSNSSQLAHVSLKLDWRMIGQMFIIDGILYGIQDKHSYSSRLQFAYDLYRCKLLSGEYLASDDEPHRRTFTNHFGDTQMIKYNPNEPKRLYTIDNGNLLWRPVKLISRNTTNLDEF